MHHSHRGARLKLRALVMAVLLAAMPVAALALGLGNIVLHSGLDEPLNGQIELISPTTQELKTLKATLASREDFDIAGVERAGHLFDIKYTLSQSPDGRHYLKLTTDSAVREPFLHFLVQVEWNGGRLIREYSALLDPPQWVSGAPAEINPPEVVIGEVPVPAVELTPGVAETPDTDPAPVTAEAPLEELPPIGTDMPVDQAGEVAVADATQPASSEPEAATTVPPPAESPVPAASGEAQQVAPQIATASEPVAPTPVVERPVETLEPAEASPGVAPTVSASPGVQEYGPVRTGETLTQIANKISPDRSLSSQQVMLALLRANPSAFFGNNVNNLRAGRVLQVPEREAMAAIPKDQAVREYRVQYDAWQEYKLKMAGASRAVEVAETGRPAADPAKTETRKAAQADKAGKDKEKVATGKAEPVDLLKIVRANLEQEVGEETTKTPGVETRKDVAREQGKLDERVATLEEAIESKQMQNKEMRDRVGKLQEQVKNTERLIDLENKDLAAAQKQATEKQAAEAAAKEVEAKAAAERAAAEKAAQDKITAEKAAAEKSAQDKAAADKQAQEKAAGEAAKPAPARQAPTVTAAKPVPAPAPAAEEGFLDSILSSVMGNDMTLALLAVVGVLAAAMGGLYVYRRRRASREFSESILSGSSLSSEVSITDTSGQAAPSDTSFLSDFSQGGMGNVHTDEVDPIAEAEVYLAYGRDEQAEEILKDAIVKDPVRQELKGKLLEIYFQRNDVAAYETLAEELYAQLEGKGGKVWDKAEEMGRKLSPSNPMFRGGKPASAVRTAAKATAATTLLVSEPETGGAESSMASGLQFDTQEMSASDLAPDVESSSDSGSIDFNVDFSGSTAQPSSGPDMAFDLDAPADLDVPAAPEAGSAGSLDLDFTMDQESTPASDSGSIDFGLADASEPDTAGGLDFASPTDTSNSGSIDFSTGGMDDMAIELDNAPGDAAEVAEATLPGWDETATKLDLAKAYIDMGDAEGARSILDEVLEEGNDQQKQQARELVSQIAA